MKKVLLLAAMLATSITAGCGSPCDALSDVCGRCEGSTKTACDTTVATYRLVLNGGSACQSVLDSGVYDSCQ